MILGIHSFFLSRLIEISLPVDKKPDDLAENDLIIYKEDDGGNEVGKIVYFTENLRHADSFSGQREFLRKMTAHDTQKYQANEERSAQAFTICRKKILDHKLEMFLNQATYSFDGNKINFVFTAEDRVDFRDLVKDLAVHFKKQIHLQQIGPRDKAKMSGGFGRCGRGLCCSRWLPKLESVSMDMARIQNLANKGSEKLSGLCGKLLCCLKYEVEEYKKLRAEMPEIGTIVVLKEAEGEVVGLDALNKRLKVRLPDHNSKIIPLSEVIKVKSNTPQAISKKPEETGDIVLIS